MSTPIFDRSTLRTKPLAQRIHDLSRDAILDLGAPITFEHLEEFRNVAGSMVRAKENGSNIIMMMGGHVIRAGVQKYIIDLMARGYISCLAMNGSGVIHDFELALIGATTESVARYIKTGEFGLWHETGCLMIS